MKGPYPPPYHILSDLGLQIDRRDGDLRVSLPVHEHLLDAGASLRAGILGVALDVFAGNLAVEAARPDWALTSELSLHRLAPISEGTLVVTGYALRAGRTQVVIEATARSEGGGSGDPVRNAFGTIGFTRVPRRADTPDSPGSPGSPGDSPDVFHFGDPGARLDAPLLDAIGMRELDAAAGRLEIPLTPYVKNSVGGLQGGVVTSLVDAAAAAAGAALFAAPACVEDFATRFLALGRGGPIRSHATLLRRSDDTALFRIELRDAGQEDRLVTVATATVRAA